MAAYAALNSVMFILQQIQHHPRPPITIEKQHMDSLCEIISFLQDFLENYSHRGDIGGGKEALETRIADAAYAAEDIIESHIVDQILAKSNTFIKMIGILKGSNSLFCQDLQKVIEDMDLIKKEVIQIQEKIRGIDDDQLPTNIISMSANIIGSSTVRPATRKHCTNTMVGFDDVLIQIMDRLTVHPPNRQVLPIVGMGGIGKTTLARNVYDHPTIVEHFHIRIWVTISQEYRLRDILLEALCCHHNLENNSEDELGDQLHKSLCGRKYLIILDDMWSIEAWEKLMRFLPDNSNGSRIMITTRLSNVSNHFGSYGFKMNFLDEDKSWDLFCKIVFPQDQCCPLELEEIGKKIARNCKGLPLSIVVIAGLLSNSEKTLEKWEYVEKNLNSVVNLEDDKHCLKILFLSYNHLPVHLKPCFLYLGVYPEGQDICVRLLIKLWVAEGFLKPMEGKTLEMAGREYFNQLIDRNLILVDEWGCSGKVKYCKIHDLLRDLCLREGQKDKFLWVRTVHNFDNLEGIQSQRRIGIHKGASKERFEYGRDRVLKVLPSVSRARSLIFDSKDVLSFYSFRLMRVLLNRIDKYSKLEPLKGYYSNSLKDIFKSVNLRCLFVVQVFLDFPSSIHLLWNLQTLVIIDDDPSAIGNTINMVVPPQIWEMSQLRHLESYGNFLLPDPPNVSLIHGGDDGDLILRNLQTLKTVINFKLSEEVIKRIPNIKKLGVSYLVDKEGHDYCLNNLHLLNKLQSLCIKTCFGIEGLQKFAFPCSLKKLTLEKTFLHWEDMRMIGSLPHLQILKLKQHSFLGPEWNPVQGEFLCLKFLQIKECNSLVWWNADSTHFPCLEHLALWSLDKMKEIPLDIGQIPTLRLIDLRFCSKFLVLSAKKILDEQVNLGNEDLQVKVTDIQYHDEGFRSYHYYERGVLV